MNYISLLLATLSSSCQEDLPSLYHTPLLAVPGWDIQAFENQLG